MNADTYKREYESYRKDDTEARSILDTAAAENRAVTPEEEERFDKLFDSARKHKTLADKLKQMDDDGNALEAMLVRSTPQTAAISAQVRAAGVPEFNSRLLDLFHKQIEENARGNSKFEQEISATVDLEKRAIADFSDNGALYTTDFATQVAIYQRTVSPWINLATIINADNGRPLNLPVISADPTAYAPGEGTAITEATPTTGSAALTTTAYKALSYVSAETLDDELIGIMPIIAKTQGRSIGLKFGSDLTTAVLAAATNGGTAAGTGGNGTATVTFFGYEDLLDLKYGLAVPYRNVGNWVMSNAAIKKVRKFKDGQQRYYWQPAIAAGQPDTFDGDAVYEDPYLAAPASATKSVLYGELSLVVIKQMPLRIATSSEFRFSNDQVALKTVYRAGGAVPDGAGIRYLISANT